MAGKTQQKNEIWIVDDHRLFSAGMKQLIESVAQNYTVKCYDTPQEAVTEHETTGEVTKVSLIVMDFYIPGVDATLWIKNVSVRYPQTPLIVISSSTSSTDKKTCIDAGATAYYPKHAPPEFILKHLSAFLEEGLQADNQDTELIPSCHGLTARQVEILIQVARGHSNKKIARLLDLSPETVKTHLASIYKLIPCDSRDGAVDWAREKGLV